MIENEGGEEENERQGQALSLKIATRYRAKGVTVTVTDNGTCQPSFVLFFKVLVNALVSVQSVLGVVSTSRESEEG